MIDPPKTSHVATFKMPVRDECSPTFFEALTRAVNEGGFRIYAGDGSVAFSAPADARPLVTFIEDE